MLLYSLLRVVNYVKTKPAKKVAKEAKSEKKGVAGDRRHFLTQIGAGFGYGYGAGAVAIASSLPACGIPDAAVTTEADILLKLANKAYTEAQLLTKAKKTTEANALYRVAVKRYIELATYYPQYATKDRTYSAQQGLERAADLCLNQIVDYAEARTVLELFVDNYPQAKQVPGYLMTLGNLLREELNLPREAIKAYRKIIEDYSGSNLVKEASLVVADIFYKDLRLVDMALALYEQHYNRYINSSKKEDLDSAAKALLEIAYIYYEDAQYKDLSKAIANYETFLSLFYNHSLSPEIALRVAGIKYDIAKTKAGSAREQAMLAAAKAYDFFVDNYQAHPKASRSTLSLAAEISGDIYDGELKNEKVAADRYKTSLKLYPYPNYVGAEKLWLKLGYAYWGDKNYQEAYLAFSAFHNYYPDNKEAEWVYYLIIQTKKELKEYSTACILYEQFFKMYPSSKLREPGMYDAAELYAANYNFGDAIRTYQRILKDYPSSNKAEFALFKIGDHYEYMNRRQEAVTAYEKYLGKYGLTSAYSAQVLASLKKLCVYPGITCQPNQPWSS